MPTGLLPAGGFALAACGIVLGLLYYWYAVADRYAVFLYNHLGAMPFDEVTAGRYWMAGLVASSVVLAVNVALNWLAGRAFPRYLPPGWLATWLLAAPLAAVGAYVIAMFGGKPQLPAEVAVACAIATTAGLALALMPARSAARSPSTLVWHGLHGLAVAPLLLLFRVIELPGRLPSVSANIAVAVAAASLAASGVALGLLAATGRRLGREVAPPAVSLAAGFAIAYLLLPLAHHVLATPPAFRYISASANFFATDWRLQVFTWATAAALAAGAHWLGRRL